MWKVKYTKKFLKELAKIPQKIQERVERIVFIELKEGDSFSLGYIREIERI